MAGGGWGLGAGVEGNLLKLTEISFFGFGSMDTGFFLFQFFFNSPNNLGFWGCKVLSLTMVRCSA